MNLFTSLLVLIVLVSVQALTSKEKLEKSWNDFKVNYSRQYTTPKEEHDRKAIFFQQLRLVEQHNADYAKGLTGYKMAVNKFSDYTEEEKYKLTHSVRVPADPKQYPVYEARNTKDELPDSVDWRSTGAIQAVRDQGGCGSCWAFSALGALEAHLNIKAGRTVDLSEQNLVDCVSENWGCSGGWMNTAYEYIIANDGVDAEDAYPYEGFDGDCRYSDTAKDATVFGIVNIEEGNEVDMKSAVALEGPVAIAIDASGNFMGYSSGVYYNENCNNVVGTLDHAVTVVGYGVEDGQDYWLVRNSWGSGWGEDGYIKMARNRDNNCGVAAVTSYPIVVEQ